MAKILLPLNEYQAANLRWLLQVAWNCPRNEYPSLNTGDWVGEIPQILEQLMIEHDVKHPANANDAYANKPLVGTCCGMNKTDYELKGMKQRLERIHKVLALKDISEADKCRMIDELAMGCVNIDTIRLIEK